MLSYYRYKYKGYNVDWLRYKNLDERYTYTHGYLRSALDISSAQRETQKKEKHGQDSLLSEDEKKGKLAGISTQNLRYKCLCLCAPSFGQRASGVAG